MDKDNQRQPEPAASGAGDDFETRHAIMEAERNDSADEYFKARHEMLDTIHNRRIFEAGFQRGWDKRDARLSRAQHAAPEGMPASQEPKYGIRENRLYNRASGEFIPLDEPVFIFRARDSQAFEPIHGYANRFAYDMSSPHYKAVMQRVDHFQQFMKAHPERMKFPDTAAPSTQPQGDSDV